MALSIGDYVLNTRLDQTGYVHGTCDAGGRHELRVLVEGVVGELSWNRGHCQLDLSAETLQGSVQPKYLNCADPDVQRLMVDEAFVAIASALKQLHGSPHFYAVVLEMLRMHHTKNQDYAGDGDPFKNFKESAAFAGTSVEQAIDMHRGNKRSRERNLRGADKTNHESRRDTMLDDMTYTGLRIAWNDAEAESTCDEVLSPDREALSKAHIPAPFS